MQFYDRRRDVILGLLKPKAPHNVSARQTTPRKKFRQAIFVCKHPESEGWVVLDQKVFGRRWGKDKNICGQKQNLSETAVTALSAVYGHDFRDKDVIRGGMFTSRSLRPFDIERTVFIYSAKYPSVLLDMDDIHYIPLDTHPHAVWIRRALPPEVELAVA